MESIQSPLTVLLLLMISTKNYFSKTTKLNRGRRHSDPYDDAAFLAQVRSVCPTKVPHESRKEATIFASKLGGSPYLCPFCGYWHNTTMDRKAQRDFKRRLSRILRKDELPKMSSFYTDACDGMSA